MRSGRWPVVLWCLLRLVGEASAASPSPIPTPLTIPGLAQWFDASDINGNGSPSTPGTPVSTWVDKSSMGISFTMATPANQPTVSTDSNGYTSVLFTVNSGMTSNYVGTGTGPRTVRGCVCVYCFSCLLSQPCFQSFMAFSDVNTTSLNW